MSFEPLPYKYTSISTPHPYTYSNIEYHTMGIEMNTYMEINFVSISDLKYQSLLLQVIPFLWYLSLCCIHTLGCTHNPHPSSLVNIYVLYRNLNIMTCKNRRLNAKVKFTDGHHVVHAVVKGASEHKCFQCGYFGHKGVCVCARIGSTLVWWRMRTWK